MSLDLSKLSNVREKDGKTTAACPACAENGGDTRGDHLVIWPDGRFGCVIHPQDSEHRKRIFALAGLKNSANQETKALSKMRILAVYDYHDETGNPLFQVVRMEPKTFRQRHKINGEWVWKMDGVRRVLYRLPKVAEAEMLWIVEGERDVESLEAIGFIATCNPGGALKWRAEFSETLCGKQVIIIPDNDEPGRKHVEQVARSLHGKAASIKVLMLPETENGAKVKDVSDFICAFQDKGDAGERLAVMAEDAAEWTPPLATVEASAGINAPQGAIILPSQEVSITESAREIFTRFAPRGNLFLRGGVVVEVVSEKGILCLRIIKPSAFRSMIEMVGKTFSWRAGRKGDPVLAPGPCSELTGKAILDCHVARDILPKITAIVGCPVFLETPEGGKILNKGHDPESGILVSGGGVEEVDLPEGIELLFEIVAEYDFQTPGDRARALAMLITPALKWGGFILGSVPCDVAEANLSQSGKGYRQQVTAAVYGEKPRLVTRRDGGVGGLDESFSSAIVEGRPFIQIDNLRDKLASQHLEAFMTCEGDFPCRIPGHAEIRVDCTKMFVQLTSNAVELTPDFANRSSIIRIFKRVGHRFKEYPEGDLRAHVRANQPKFLGAVFAVIREWLKRGKPRSKSTDHSFREWLGVLDWISQELLMAGPLMAGHLAAQERVSNPNLTFLRGLALAIEKAGRMGESMIASQIYEIAEGDGLTIPGLKDADEDKGKRMIGIIMGGLFKAAPSLEIEGFRVERRETMTPREGGGDYCAKTYTFTKP